MKEDAGLRGGVTGEAGRGSGSYKSSKWRTISNYWRSISANATSVASTVRTVGSSYGPQSSGVEEEQQREQVLWAGFEMLELGPTDVRHVLLLAYLNGFQVWDVDSANNVRELVSRRDGPVSYLRLQPRPCTQESFEGIFKAVRPLLLVISGEASGNVGSVPGGYNVGHIGSDGAPSGSFMNSLPTVIRFYSLQTHQYVHTLRFGAGIYGVRCSRRVVAVAFVAQIYCYDANTLQSILSVLTYPNLQTGSGGVSYGFGAMAVGPRWLAYAANQPLVSCTGRASPQHLTPSPGVSPSTSPANGNLVAYYAKESSKQLAAGIITLGDMGYKTLSRYYSELLPDGAGSPGSGSPRLKSNNGSVLDPDNAGTVIVRDFVSKAVVAQFRAHKSPLSALCFDRSGTLLVTASVQGHNLNVYLLMPQSTANVNMSMAYDSTMSYVHLYKLYRGITNAVIQDIVFSNDSRWICVSSSRGTSHLYAISPFGGSVGHHTHSGMAVNGIVRSKAAPLPVVPWWSSSGPVKIAQQVLSPPPTLVLSVVNRIKNGPAGWRGTVSGAAAAATGRTSSSGAVAAIFHDGGDYDSEFQRSPDALNDKLWILCPSGHLVRYLLRPSAGGHMGFTDGSIAEVGSPGFDSYQGHDFGLYVEALEKWDVYRRPNWSEREERIHSLVLEFVESDEALSGKITNHVASETRGEQGWGPNAEDRQRLYMSKAEIQMQQARPFPIWAKPNISFEVLLLDAKKDLSSHVGQAGGEIEIEKLPTRVVELRRKDLTPVIERFKSQDLREASGENFSTSLNSASSHPRDDTLHDELVGRHTTGTQSIRSTSFGREVDSVPGNNFYMDGFHHDYGGFQAQTQRTSSTMSPRLAHQSHLAISGLDDDNPLLRASGSISKHGLQSATSVAESQKHKEKNAKFSKIGLQVHAVSGAENTSIRLTDMDNLSSNYSNSLDHLAHGFAAAMVVNERKEGYFQVRDDNKEDVKTVNADIKTVDADCRSGLRHDARSLQGKSRAINSVTCAPYGSPDGHILGQLDHHDSVTGQNTWRIEEYGKDLSVVQFHALTASHQEPTDQRVGYQLQTESTQDISKKVFEGINKIDCNDSLEDADGSDSYSQHDENIGESGGEVWDGAMFPFNEEGS